MPQHDSHYHQVSRKQTKNHKGGLFHGFFCFTISKGPNTLNPNVSSTYPNVVVVIESGEEESVLCGVENRGQVALLSNMKVRLCVTLRCLQDAKNSAIY